MPRTIAEATRHALAQLQDHSDAPAIDVQRLLLHVLGVNETSYLLTHSDQALTPAQERSFAALCAGRTSGEPLGYILGSWGFYGRSFLVTPDVLIPRPSTEELVTQALAAIEQLYAVKKRPLTIADIGTGSGCVATTLLLECGDKIERVYATDISAAALRVAKKNADQFGVADRIEFLPGSLLDPLLNKKVDLIVSNPPYVPTAELRNLTALEKRGLAFEPRQALDGGSDGRSFSEQLVTSKIPVIIEVTGGSTQQYNFPK